MKLQLLAATALSSCGIASVSSSSSSSSPPAFGYLFRRTPSDATTTHHIPRQAARLLMHQRLGVDEASSLKDLEGLPDVEAALESLDRLSARPSVGLFDDEATSGGEPAQFVVLVHGVDGKAMEAAMADFRPSFEVADPPRDAAHADLVDDILDSSMVAYNKCEMSRAVNPSDFDCWGYQKAGVVLVDAAKEPNKLAALDSVASTLDRLAQNGDMETLVLLIPEASRMSKTKSWAGTPQQPGLRRRQSEAVMATMDDEKASAAPASQATSPATAASVIPAFAARKKKTKIAACFATHDACMAATGNCTGGQGKCRNKWRKSDDDDEGEDEDGEKRLRRDGDESGKKRPACFACECLKKSHKSTTQWAGPTCDKMDMSTPVALFIGIAILLAIATAGAITMLFGIGNEPLPGVLGAGVSRNK